MSRGQCETLRSAWRSLVGDDALPKSALRFCLTAHFHLGVNLKATVKSIFDAYLMTMVFMTMTMAHHRTVNALIHF